MWSKLISNAMQKSAKMLFLAVVLYCTSSAVVMAAVPLSDFFPYGMASGDVLLGVGDDTSSAPINLQVLVPFVSNRETTIYVNVNGALSFASPISTYTAECRSMGIGMRMMAPFWTDIQTNNGLGGSVFYRQTTRPTELTKATREVLAAYPNVWDFSANWVFVATWENVTYFGAQNCITDRNQSERIVPRNTFQVAVASNGKYTFTIMYYNSITWTTGTASSGSICTGTGGSPAKVGFDAGDGRNFFAVPGSCTDAIIDIDDMSNVGYPGKWIFRTDDANIAVSCGGPARLTPTYIDAFGHVPVQIQGPCVNLTAETSCTFVDRAQGAVEVKGRVFLSLGVPTVECIAPFLYSSGMLTVVLNVRDSNETAVTKQYQTSLWVVWELPGVEVRNATINNSSVEVQLKWDQNTPVLNSAYKVDVALLLYDSERWRILGLVGRNLINSGYEVVTVGAANLNISSETLALSVLSFAIIPVDNERSISSGLSSSVTWITTKAVSFVEVASDFIFEAPCRSWYNRDNGPPKGLQSCPPLLSQASVDPAFEPDANPDLDFFHPGAIASFRSVRMTPSGAGQQCTYGPDGRILVGQPGGGTADMVSPNANVWRHFKEDVVTWYTCCKWGTRDTCELYYDKRPSDSGANYVPPQLSQANGDPHFTTFDNLQYTFNGAGEFWLVRPLDRSVEPAADTAFRMQARLQPVGDQTQARSPTATAFTAFVAQQGNGSIVQVQLSSQTAVLDVLVDGVKLTFDEPALYTRMLNGASLSTQSADVKTVSLTFASFSFAFSAANGAMSIVAAAESDAVGKYAGLLGYYDGQSSNDLRTPAGAFVDSQSNMSTIHHDFGVHWLVQRNDSLFTYANGYSYDSYYLPSFTPTFSTPDVSSLPSQVLAVCGSSVACMYDYAVTGSLAFANQTATEQAAFNQTTSILQQVVIMCPAVSRPQNGYMQATNFFAGSNVTFSCEEGYSLIGANQIFCLNGTWSSDAPECKTSGTNSPSNNTVRLSIGLIKVLSLLLCFIVFSV